jgi:hypothetical protein
VAFKPSVGLSVSKLDGGLASVHDLFSGSNQRQGQRPTIHMDFLMLPVDSFTRWSSRWLCIRALHDNYNVLLLFLRDRVQRRVGASCQSNSALVALRDVNVRTSVGLGGHSCCGL